jgi:hypothetical protein
MSSYSYKLVNEESVSAVTATPSVQLGTRRLENGIEYVYAYNASSGTVNKGAPVILTATSGYTFVSTYATGADKGCVILGTVHNATMTVATYGWIATRGIMNVYVVSAAVAAQDTLIIKDGGGEVRVATFTSSLTQLAGGGCIVGRALEVNTAANSGCISVYRR